jgi:peptidoglycan hydrolase-like protein with peptidoglycan-binding domain/3D (Asp-Asp-Asp) domain-containing protein
MHIPLRIRLAVSAICICTSTGTAAQVANAPEKVSMYEKDFIITAYYSPLPDQCCYVKGSFETDKILNGNGTHGADGTPVYEGLIAAPPSYAFGTRVEIPGLGVVTVHDRGGAIQSLDTGADRLDIWVGSGEEGLARALAFGVMRVKGKVYPPSVAAPAESFSINSLKAPLDVLQAYVKPEHELLVYETGMGAKDMSARTLQEALKELSYFDRSVSGYFGEETKMSVARFQKDFGLTEEASDHVSEKTAVYVTALLERRRAQKDKKDEITSIAEAQRLLRFLGYYRGRTDGKDSAALHTATYNFQKDRGIVGSITSLGAGILGPVTKKNLLLAKERVLVSQRAEQILAMRQLNTLLTEKGYMIEHMLAEGDTGEQVRRLQSFLASNGFLPKDRVTKTFGQETKKAVLAYQMARGIVENANTKGAGVLGPKTLGTLRHEVQKFYAMKVKGQGWGVL